MRYCTSNARSIGLGLLGFNQRRRRRRPRRRSEKLQMVLRVFLPELLKHVLCGRLLTLDCLIPYIERLPFVIFEYGCFCLFFLVNIENNRDLPRSDTLRD